MERSSNPRWKVSVSFLQIIKRESQKKQDRKARVKVGLAQRDEGGYHAGKKELPDCFVS